ncbi:MAG TPA: UDP-glucose/GDP-mannose dehydrogenase family protein [Dehalococcoidia bacterium]|nr:UDP-glucose/GDP-mannose dehydrogenase family protein [Dehalococcoidia bacterium]
MRRHQLAVIGAGYVGLTVAACFAHLGHRVRCIECDLDKARALAQGWVPVAEPGLEGLWRRHLADGSLRVCGRPQEGLPGAEVVFLCVGTPAAPGGEADLSQVWAAANGLAQGMPRGCRAVVAIKSTVPPGTSQALASLLRSLRPDLHLSVVANPEFLREGQALADFLSPPRIVLGSDDDGAVALLEELYAPLGAPVVRCRPTSAELAKYACNAFLAARISFINEVAEVAEVVGADVAEVVRVMGLDPRIGPAYLEPGLGWGGSCLPKDLRALIARARAVGVPVPLLEAVVATNARQVARLVARLASLLGGLSGRRVALWGLAFKPGCGDTRDSPAVALGRALQEAGAEVWAYDPVASAPDFVLHRDPYRAAEGAEAVVLATAWPELKALDWGRLRSLVARPLLLDARNGLDGEAARAAGFTYIPVGRPLVGQPAPAGVEGV